MTAQPAAGELLDLCPWQLALLIARGGLQARGLGQLMGGVQRLGVVAQHGGRQQQRCYVQITLGGVLEPS